MHPWSVRFLLGLLLPILISALQAGADDAPVRPRIYQLFLRQFSNTNETRQPNGTLAVNGVGKFRDLDSTALKALPRPRRHPRLSAGRSASGHRNRLLALGPARR